MKEETFLNIIKSILPESVKYIGDDTAYIPEKDLILTQDTLIENVHFRHNTINPYYLGRKSVAVNLSDIAASGGIPQYILISLSMPENTDESFIKEFYKGVNSICQEYSTVVIGGDLTAAKEISISICAVGSGEGLIPASRRTAKPGDVIIVTGNFGSSATGLSLLEEIFNETVAISEISEEIKKKFINSHINPVPRIAEGREILKLADKPAMMDSSDGLGDALYKICQASNVGMEIDFEEIPYDKDIWEVFADENTVINRVLFGGEDYELVATVSEEIYEKLKKEIFVKKIGAVKSVDEKSGAYVKFKDGKSLKIDSKTLNSSAFQHFRQIKK
ncbi:MAG TPA: thiamine-phosphate kinase [Candidatus Gastranaerophilales bacterium]|nr:thiamine-phosphate kinase [Candidatus Gastranaerophilales bacterium]